MDGLHPVAVDTRQNLIKINLALKANIYDIYHCEGPPEVLEKLNAHGRRLIADFRRLIHDLESWAKEEDFKRNEEELLAVVNNCREQLLSTTAEFKKANIACLQAIERSNKAQLLHSEIDSNTQLKNRTKKDKANLIKKSTNITDRLLSISRHLAETIEQNSKTLDSLDEIQVDMEVNCSICDGSLKEGATVTVTPGLPTLIQASYAQKDNFHEKWAGKSSLVLHVQCRKSYTRKTSIKADEKIWEAASTSTDTSATLLPPALAFCPVSHCLFCGKDLISKSKLSEDNKRVCLIVDPNKVGSILSVAYSRKDSWGATVIARINAIGDLITAKVRYHPECEALFQ